jgi:6-phosphogluconolactonase (cycloisomerase 2 family)
MAVLFVDIVSTRSHACAAKHKENAHTKEQMSMEYPTMKYLGDILRTVLPGSVRSRRVGSSARHAVVAAFALMLGAQFGCSGGSSSWDEPIQTTHVAPADGVASSGTSVESAATAESFGGDSRDVTDSATRKSSNVKVVTIDSPGTTEISGKGVTIVSANSGEATGRTRLDVATKKARFAYVANADVNTLSIFKVAGKNEQLTAIGTVPSAGVDPIYLELHPSGEFLFVTNLASNTIASFEIHPITGALTLVAGTPVPTGSAPRNIAIDPSGKFLYVSNVSSNDISGYVISNGALTEVAGSPFATGLAPYGLTVSDSGRFLYVTNRDSNNVTAYSIDAATGSLSQIAGSPFTAGSGARDISLSASGDFAFVTNRFSNDVTVFSVDAVTGALTQIAGSPFPAGTDPRALTVDPSGQFLYVGNTLSNDLSAYAIDTEAGSLTPVPGSPFSAGLVPLGLETDPKGKFLYVSNQGSKDVIQYAIDEDTGALTKVDEVPSGGAASSIAILEAAESEDGKGSGEE